MRKLLIIALLLLFVWGCHTPQTTPPTVRRDPRRLDEFIRDYQPGQFISAKQYQDQLAEVKRHHHPVTPGFEEKLDALIRATEPEVIIAMLRVLTDPNTKTFYAGFDSPEGAVHETGRVQSPDGLLGLRVIKQLTLPGDKLLSSIQSRRYDKRHKRLVLVDGPDVLRIRIQIAPFKPRTGETGDQDGEGALPRGMLGFSWILTANDSGQIERAHAEAYMTEKHPPQDRSQLSTHEQHGMLFRFPRVTICGLMDHCVACHGHQNKRNLFSDDYIGRPVEESLGYRRFVDYLKEDPEISPSERADLETALKNPKTTFESSDLIQALRAQYGSG